MKCDAHKPFAAMFVAVLDTQVHPLKLVIHSHQQLNISCHPLFDSWPTQICWLSENCVLLILDQDYWLVNQGL